MKIFKLSKGSLAFYFLSVIIACSLASFIVGSDYSNKKSNDLKSYEGHYNCVENSLSSLESCQRFIGNPADFFYEWIVFLSKSVFGISDFDIFLLLFSFFVYFFVLRFSIRLTKYSFVPVLFMLSDFRFYELGNNVLRNGLAIVLLVLIVEFQKKKIFGIVPLFGHLSSFPYLLSSKKYLTPGLYVALAGLALILSHHMNILVSLASHIPVTVLQNKVYSYSASIDSSFSNISKSYILVFLIGLAFCYRLKEDFWFFVNFNLFFVFLFFNLLFSEFGFSYRFLNFCMPFAAVFLGRIFDYTVFRYGQFALVSGFFVLFFIFCLLFINNLSIISRGFLG